MRSCFLRSSHLQVSPSDPSIGDKFSVQSLRSGARGLVSVPSIVHGAPETTEESIETLLRLQRMAGFESQNFDPHVSCIMLMHETWQLMWPTQNAHAQIVDRFGNRAVPVNAPSELSICFSHFCTFLCMHLRANMLRDRLCKST